MIHVHQASLNKLIVTVLPSQAGIPILRMKEVVPKADCGARAEDEQQVSDPRLLPPASALLTAGYPPAALLGD